MQVWVVVGGVWGLRTPDRPEKISRGYNVKHFNLSRHGSEGCGVIFYFGEISARFHGVWGMLKCQFQETTRGFKKMTNPPDFTRIFDTRYPMFCFIGQIYMIAG